MTWYAIVAVTTVLEIAAGILYILYWPRGPQVAKKDPYAGWVYFIGALASDDAPIKIGFSHYEPTKERMPDLQTLSPLPLSVIYQYESPNARLEELRIHKHLAEFRQHGEWFDREAALSYIDHLKGEH